MELDALETLEPARSLVDPHEAEREAWMRKRSGRFTCSKFGDLMVSGRKKDEPFGTTAKRVIWQCAAERAGSFRFEFDSAPTRWGKDHERSVITNYCLRNNVQNMRQGSDTWHEYESYAGGTPDALIDDDGCIEIKCPYDPSVHFQYIDEGGVPQQYRWQVIGHLLVTGRQWCDFISFDPRVELQHLRTYTYRVKRSTVGKELEMLSERLALADAEVRRILGQ